jgi:hypothetical protein
LNRERRPFEGGLLLGFALFEIGQLRFPLGGFVGLNGSFVPFDHALGSSAISAGGNQRAVSRT